MLVGFKVIMGLAKGIVVYNVLEKINNKKTNNYHNTMNNGMWSILIIIQYGVQTLSFEHLLCKIP